MIARSNPVTGKSTESGAIFDWALSPELWKGLAEATDRLSLQNDDPYVQDYMDAFGPIQFPSELPLMPLYTSDRDTCLKAFGAVE